MVTEQLEREADATTLALRGVSVHFGGLTALDEVALCASRGEIIGIIGPNGAGKTTLLNVISGIIRPDRGSVMIDGTMCTRWAVYRRSRLGLARTFQRVTLYQELTIRDHLRLAVEGHTPIWRPAQVPVDERIETALRSLEQFGWKARPESYVGGLPLGRARLVELAMAMATEPKVLLLDEPLSGLAGAERATIVSALNTLGKNSPVTVLVVEHDLESVTRFASRLVVLDFGKVISDGTVEEVMKNENVRTAYFGESRS